MSCINKELEIQDLVKDFEEQQSEKENQMHHLKATATNTIRNLYALNGLTGENISNNIETQQIKRSISTNIDSTKDPRKRVTFDTGLKPRSSIRGPGDKGDMNETIGLSRSQKLISPYKKRTAAYTQATKSSLKDSRTGGLRDSNVSMHSIKHDGESMISPLQPTTPAKMTKGRKSRGERSFEDDPYAEEPFEDPNISMYGIPRTIDQIESNSALVEHLKSLLKNALDREDNLSNYIERLCKKDLIELKNKFESLHKADMKMREDCESLQMRNEELETRLLDSQSKLWNLKQLYLEAENLIKAMINQKQDNSEINEDFKRELMSAIDFFLMEIDSLKKKIGEHLLPASEITINRIFDEAIKKINQLNNQLLDLNNVNNSNISVIESMKKELEEIRKINDRLENQLYKYQYDISRITDVLINDAFPTTDELVQEEQSIEDISDQEKHLFLLLKRGANLREREKEFSDKISVYSKDIEELMDKNRNLADAEELKNEVVLALEHEKNHVLELEALLDEKSVAFNMIAQEKDNLLLTISTLQNEKEELKHTLDTLHQLRDQEEEEIEKTLDEAKSIIQKLEEKLHNKDEKIKKYKEKLENIEKEKTDLDKQRMSLEEDFREKERNMKLKLLWAQMEKKDLATTILKLENSSNTIQPGDIKMHDRNYDHEKSFAVNHRSSFSEERRRAHHEMTYNEDLNRYSDAYYKRESLDRTRSGSRRKTSLRRKRVDIEPHHDRTKSAISVESRAPIRPSDASQLNQSKPDANTDIR